MPTESFDAAAQRSWWPQDRDAAEARAQRPRKLIGHSDFSILRYFSEHGPGDGTGDGDPLDTTPDLIAGWCGCSRVTVVRALARLIEHGYLRRMPDGRLQRVRMPR